MCTKECFKCKEIKNISDFYKHKQMKDGHLNKCKKCTKNDTTKNRSKNIDYYREYDRSRGNRQGFEYVRNYRELYPMKYAAHKLTGNAVRDGRLEKSYVCETCKNESKNIHGHHDDYALPLVVRWLCPPCHKQWHIDNGEGKNAV